MKDKRAAALKRRRRMEMAEQLKREQDAFFADFEAHMKAEGMSVKYDKTEAWRAQRRLQTKFQKHTVMTALVAAMYWLRTEKGFGEKRLTRYVLSVKSCIDILEDRSLAKLCDDLKYDAKLDIRAMCRGWKAADNYSECIIANAALGLTAALWPMYEYFEYRKKRMRAAAEGICAIMRAAMYLKEGITPYIDYIERRTGLRISLDGETKYTQ